MAVSLKAAEVLPGRGLGPIFFGARPEEVEGVIGEAQESAFTRDGEDSYGTLKYPDGITFYFSLADGMRLDSVEVDSRSTVQLFGESLFPRTRQELLVLLRGRLTEEDQQAIRVTRNVDIEEIMMNVGVLRADFYFNLDERLQAVHWGVFFNEEDEIMWPR